MTQLTASTLASALKAAYPHVDGVDDLSDEGIAALPRHLRRVLVARYVSRPGEIVSHGDVASALGVTEKTVRSADTTAMRALGIGDRRRAGPERLSPDEELRLIAAYQAGDRAAGDALVRACATTISQLSLASRGRGLDEEDLRQEGALAFLHAARMYDPSFGVRLERYAWHHVRVRSFRATVKQGRVVYVPHHVVRALRAGRRMGISTADGLVEAGLLSERLASPAIMFTAGMRSADTTVDEAGQPIIDTVADEALAPDEQLEYAEVRRELLHGLNDRERRIAEARLLADPGAEVSLSEVGVEFDLSGERIRQIEARLIQKLWKRMKALQREEKEGA